ncbi:hypothetical protein V8C35DRAFT_303339 [Trichoderma chlorosporum]
MRSPLLLFVNVSCGTALTGLVLLRNAWMEPTKCSGTYSLRTLDEAAPNVSSCDATLSPLCLPASLGKGSKPVPSISQNLVSVSGGDPPVTAGCTPLNALLRCGHGLVFFFFLDGLEDNTDDEFEALTCEKTSELP